VRKCQEKWDVCILFSESVKSRKFYKYVTASAAKTVILLLRRGPLNLFHAYVEDLKMFRNMVFFYSEILVPLSTHRLQNDPLSAVRNCCFSFACCFIWVQKLISHTERRVG
jgi:hypothetical protein